MGIEIKVSTPTQVVLGLARQNRDLLTQTSIQVASGNKHQDYKGFAADGTVERLISFRETVSNVNNYITNNNIVVARIDTTDQVVSQIQDIAAGVAQLIAQRRNSASGQDIAVDVQGQAILDDIAGKLNTKFDGRFLFSGGKTNTTPVENIQAPNLDNDNEPTAGYYNGDGNQPSIKVSDSQTVQYGVLANEEAFQQLIGAVHLAIEGHEANSDDILEQASNLIENAIQSLTSVRATIVTARDTINDANAVHNDTSLIIGENLVNVAQTDIVQASTKISELEAIIQATYLSFSRLSNLRLSNFLN